MVGIVKQINYYFILFAYCSHCDFEYAYGQGIEDQLKTDRERGLGTYVTYWITQFSKVLAQVIDIFHQASLCNSAVVVMNTL